MAIGITSKPYQDMIRYFSKTLTHTPVTKTTDNISGAETLTDGTDVTIKGAFFRDNNIQSQEAFGLFEGADAVLKVLPNITINKNDKITYDSQAYRVEKDPIMRYLGNTEMYILVGLYKI